MKYSFAVILFFCLATAAHAQRIIVPDSLGWNSLREGQALSFVITTDDAQRPQYHLEGEKGLGIALDSIGNFSWTPPYSLVDRLEKQKEFNVIIQAVWKDGKACKQVAQVYRASSEPGTDSRRPSRILCKAIVCQPEVLQWC